MQQQLQQRPTTTDQEGSQHEQPGPSQLNTDLHLTTVVSQPQHSMHQAPSSQQLHQQTPALQSDAACSSEVTASRDEQTEYNSGQHAADSPPAQQAHHDAQEPSLHQAPSTQTEHGEDPNSEEADERRQLPRQSQDQANTLARRSAESEQQEAEPLVKHQAEVDAGSQNSEEDNSDQEEEEEEPEPQPKPMSKLEAYRARGRKGKGAGYVKQDVRQSQRKASRSRKSIAAADGSAGRGRKTSRGRASTPAARAASAQKPQRTTSRKTAGKRRQSPS